jgi:hypothetical protein
MGMTGLEPCLVVGQEHDGRSLTAPNMIMPMSASRWVAMNTGATVSKIGSALFVGIDGQAAVDGSGVAMVPNSTYYNGNHGRDTVLIVERARVTPANPKYDPFLLAVLTPSVSDSLTNVSDLTRSRSGSLKKKFGFLAPLELTTSYTNTVNQ